MKTKQFVSQIWRTLLVVLPAMLLTFELTACDPKGTAARNRLGLLLDDNPDMTAEALLDSLDSFKGVVPDFDVKLPVTDEDIRPYEVGRYVNEELGKSLRFHLTDTIDNSYCIGKVNIDYKDTVTIKKIHAWGKGIYTICSTYTKTDEEGNEQQAWGHEPRLICVYAQGDSILITEGFKASEQIFHFEGKD
jgi:hypothetical protein